MELYNTSEAQALSGVAWPTLHRWGDLLEAAGLRHKDGKARNSPIYYTREGVRFLKGRQGNAGPSGVPDDPALVRKLFELFDGGMDIQQVADELDENPLSVQVWANECGVFEEINENG